MADNNFNELLIHTLKQIHVRLDRLDAKVDEKSDKRDVEALSEDFKSLDAKLDEKADKLGAKLDEKADKTDVKELRERMDRVESRLDRIESEVGTFKWVLGIGLTAMGVLMTLLKLL